MKTLGLSGSQGLAQAGSGLGPAERLGMFRVVVWHVWQSSFLQTDFGSDSEQFAGGETKILDRRQAGLSSNLKEQSERGTESRRIQQLVEPWNSFRALC